MSTKQIAVALRLVGHLETLDSDALRVALAIVVLGKAGRDGLRRAEIA